MIGIMPESMPGQDTLFDVVQPPIKRVTRKPGNGRPRWTRYKPIKSVRCDDCMYVLYLAKGDGPASMPARWRRKQGESDLLLCFRHAEVRREEDGLKSLKGKD